MTFVINTRNSVSLTQQNLTLLVNITNIKVILNGHALENPNCVKYLGLLIDNDLFWKNQITSVIKKCCQFIDFFKKIISQLIVHYYNIITLV